MKKILTGILIASVMTLSACASGAIAGRPDIDRIFTAKAEIATGGETLSGQLSRTAENCWTLTVDEPYALQGMTVTFNNGETTFSMLGFECKTDFSDSAVSVLKLAAEAYEAAVLNSGSFENGVIETTNENGTFSVTLDENGTPALIEAGGVSVKLSELSEEIAAESGSDELILLE